MKTKKLNLFIVAENALVVNGLRHHLEDRFGSSIRISSFFDCKTCLKNVDSSTDAIVLDYFLEGKKGTDLLRTFKAKNPNIQGIFHSNNRDVAAAIETVLKGVLATQPASKQYTYKFDDQYNHYYARF